MKDAKGFTRTVGGRGVGLSSVVRGGEANRECGGGQVTTGEVVLKDIKGFSKTVGGSGVGLSFVRVGVRGEGANREFGGGLVTTG